MQPLSDTTRRLYLILFVGLFFSVLPAVILYANGWRWSGELGLYKTGGIFISVPYADAAVTLDGEPIGTSGFFDRSFYVGDLAPAAYVVEVSSEGYLGWSRILVVEPQLVTDAQALLFPTRIEFTRLAFTGTATTGLAVLPRAEYDDYLAAFSTTTDDAIASSATSTPQDVSEGIGLFVEDGDVYARWLNVNAFPPSRFCGRPSFCVPEIMVERTGEEAISARFFRGGVVYSTREGGVYFAEHDVRPSTVSAQIYAATSSDFRVINDSLIIKSGTTLYQVAL